MNRVKKTARLLAFICLIILAGIGIGISGGVPIPLSKKRGRSEKDKIELIENQLKKSDTKKGQVKG